MNAWVWRQKITKFVKKKQTDSTKSKASVGDAVDDMAELNVFCWDDIGELGSATERLDGGIPIPPEAEVGLAGVDANCPDIDRI